MKWIPLTIALLLLSMTTHAYDGVDEPATLQEWLVVESVLFGLLADSMDARQLMCHIDALRDKIVELHDENGEVSRRLLIATVVWHTKHIGDYDGPACWPNPSTEEN